MPLSPDFHEGNINLYLSNDLKLLSERLTKKIFDDPLGVFEEEWLVTQTSGMNKWLFLRLAEDRGCVLNWKRYYPYQLEQKVYDIVFDDDLTGNPLAKNSLPWTLFKTLKSLENRPSDLEPVYRFTGDDDRRLYSFCHALAYLFDEYERYRPELIETWKAGRLFYSSDETEKWQWKIYQMIKDKGISLLDLRSRFYKAMEDNPRKIKSVLNERMKRVYYFGIIALPDSSLEFIYKLSFAVEVNLFIMNPSRDFWGDILSRKEIVRYKKRHALQRIKEEELHYTEGNELLANWGKTGRDFFTRLYDFPFYQEIHDFIEIDSDEADLLDDLKKKIFAVKNPKKKISIDDDSIFIISVSNRVRELEVLNDYILSVLDGFPDMEPKDMLVMAPNIDDYYPYVEKVFSSVPEDRRVPFSVSDYSLESSHFIKWVLKLFKILKSRFTVNDVLDFLDSRLVKKQFDLNDNEIEIISNWVKKAGIHWGLDGAHMKKFVKSHSLSIESSWEKGLERLLLGECYREGEEALFQGKTPVFVSNSDGLVALNKLIEIMGLFKRYASLMEVEREISQWGAILDEIVECFLLADNDFSRERSYLKKQFYILKNKEEMGEVNYDFILHVLEKSIRNEKVERNYIHGGVTFCSLVPMRSIPFRFIALIGMGDEDFPRKPVKFDFDLMKRYPLWGENDPRESDRYLFLETLLSSRDFLYISYVGNNPHDGSELPPSIVVTELMDYIQRYYDLKKNLTVKYPDQKSDSRIFSADCPQWFSFAREWDISAMKKKEKKKMEFSYSEAPEELLSIDLESFVGFFKQSAAFFFRNKLQARLLNLSEEIKDDELIFLDGLGAYEVKNSLINEGGEVPSRDPKFKALLAEKESLPRGGHKEDVLKYEYLKLKDFLEKTRPYTSMSRMEEKKIFQINGVNILYENQNIYNNEMIWMSPVKIKEKYQVEFVLRHLFFCLFAGERISKGIFMDKELEGKPLPHDEALSLLVRLVAIYKKGINRPLGYEPYLSNEWVKKRGKQSFDLDREREFFQEMMKKAKDNDYGCSISDEYLLKYYPYLLEDPEYVKTFTENSLVLDEIKRIVLNHVE